jgi:hypothetical protein
LTARLFNGHGLSSQQAAITVRGGQQGEASIEKDAPVVVKIIENGQKSIRQIARQTIMFNE